MHKDRQILIFNLLGCNNIGYPSTRGLYGHGYPGTKFPSSNPLTDFAFDMYGVNPLKIEILLTRDLVEKPVSHCLDRSCA